jgi:phospholipid/cholesterol/gamma-HCH transport system substrate-binding protein
MTPFRERNPAIIGAAGIVVLLLIFVLAFNSSKLPFIGGGTTYAADFTDLSGLVKGNDVRVAGVKIGTISGTELKNGYVRVTFKVKGADLGSETTAAIRIRTLLGLKYLSLDPAGPGELSTKHDIPLSRTTTPFDVPQAFEHLASDVGSINTAELAKSFDAISSTFHNSPAFVKQALSGLSRLSETVASRDAVLHDLLNRADSVTNVLASRDQQVRSLIDDGDLLLQTVQARRAAIHSLLVHTSVLAQQLIGIVRDNRAQIHPALTRLHEVVAILHRNQHNLDVGLKVLAPFVRDFANTLGNGEWFDTVVYNLPPINPTFCVHPGCFKQPTGTG